MLQAVALATQDGSGKGQARTSFCIEYDKGAILAVFTELELKGEGISRTLFFPGNALSIETAPDCESPDPEPDETARGDWALEIGIQCCNILEKNFGHTIQIDEMQPDIDWFPANPKASHMLALGFPSEFVNKTMSLFDKRKLEISKNPDMFGLRKKRGGV